MVGRPFRLKLPDFAGRLLTLPDEQTSWRQIKEGGPDILLLGTGPGAPWDLAFAKAALENGATVYCLENPKTESALAACRKASVPSRYQKQWQQVDRSFALARAPDCSIYFYTPGLRLEPEFWAPLLARIEIHGHSACCKQGNFVWLPGNDRQLLHRDLRQALLHLGYSKICEGLPEASLKSLLAAWTGELPDLALSINFSGLDGNGHIFQLCRELGVKLAIWLVDNPWNLLSSIKLPWWQEANLFVTDPSFIDQMKSCGARNVWYLPLAASPVMLDYKAVTGKRSAPAFVGSSEFADKDKFFAGLKITPALQALARAAAAGGRLPDFHWWQERCKGRLWPGNEARLPAFGAEESSAWRRSEWVAGALACGTTIFGDKGWEQLLPDSEILPPVDYYATLPQIYAESSCILNVTSLLLPESLNQRHFDVWAAGGFLLTDYTPGLKLFPSELVEPIILTAPADFCPKLRWLNENPGRKRELKQAWSDCIRSEHRYEHRLTAIRAILAD